ncbi:hypothetical protein TIFTF001_003211 [Ficus carica]|uniref:Uncharacterized protein n=1 Tax=Ficus carica TaxID=3494 RepID=A0AA87Z720_FICCA|nr:hypothetical protein TIFTF001_003211 [Ficus carica]
MCRSTDYHGFPIGRSRDRLKIRSFVVDFSGLDAAGKPLPHSLTLVYLPRINDSALEVSGSKIRPDTPAFVSLHRGGGGGGGGEISFGSKERVVVSEGVRFEVYLREEKVLKGNFRRDEDDDWRLDCGCAMETKIDALAAAAAEVRVSAEGGVAAMRESVAMAVGRRRPRWCGRGLEEIPEEREVESEDDQDDRTAVCDSDCEGRGSDGWGGGGGDGDGMDGGDEEGIGMDMDMEGVGWAVDREMPCA